MYSKLAGKYMPFWMEFWKGQYGIHALPEKVNGDLDTSAKIGESAGGSCVRLEKKDAEKLYAWVDTGTMVLISYNKIEFANLKKDTQTIMTYYHNINQGDYEKAFAMRTSKAYVLKTFIQLYRGITVEVEKVSQIVGGEYVVTLATRSNGKQAKKSKVKFFISEGKIIRSFVL